MKINSLELVSRFSFITEVILGIISPPFSINTISPILKSSLFISLKLCNEAFLITEPLSLMGLSFATGVIAPVLPT